MNITERWCSILEVPYDRVTLTVCRLVGLCTKKQLIMLEEPVDYAFMDAHITLRILRNFAGGRFEKN